MRVTREYKAMTVRVPPEVYFRVRGEAAARSISICSLIESVLSHHFGIDDE